MVKSIQTLFWRYTDHSSGHSSELAKIMKPKILLVDDSLTVQKVVALSLDRNRFQILFAKSSVEAIRSISESQPSVVLVSDTVLGPNASSFPKEVELRLGRDRQVPPMVLISARSKTDSKHYAGTLQKPFTPQALAQSIDAVMVGSTAGASNETLGTEAVGTGTLESGDDQRLHQIFNNAFAHESDLARETLEEAEKAQAGEAQWTDGAALEPVDMIAPLWDGADGANLQYSETGGGMGQTDNSNPDAPAMPATKFRQNSTDTLRDLDSLVARKLDAVLPGIVERLVQERLDKLLKEQEDPPV